MSADAIDHHEPVPLPIPRGGGSFDRVAGYEYRVVHGALVVTPRPGIPPLTADDVPELPYGYRDEIIGGRLIVTPSAGGAHQYLASKIYALLEARAPEGWIPVLDVNVKVSLTDDDFWRPDIAVLRPGESMDATWFTFSQFGLLGEVVSPSTEWLDRTDKLRTYAEQGVACYWLIERGTIGKSPSISIHSDPDGGAYRQVVRVGPGETYPMVDPFEFQITPDEMVGRLR